LIISSLKYWVLETLAIKKMAKERIIRPKVVTVTDLLGLLNQADIASLVDELKADKWVIKLKTGTVFQLILYSLLQSDRISLRTMQDNYVSALFKAVEHLAVDAYTAHSSIRDRLVNIKVEFFERLYERVYGLVEEHYGEKELSGYNLKRYDSTMISVFSHLMEGMKVGDTSKKKNQVKLSTELVNDFQVRMRFFKDQDHLGEEVALKELITSQTHTKTDLVVFDRGIKSRQTFCDLKSDNTLFVTRLNDKNRYKFIRQHQPTPNQPIDHLDFIQDSIVYLYGDGGKIVKEEFRLIEVQRAEDDKKLFFLTNILHLSPQMIAQIYRSRWDIEVFFRFMKQEMNLTHFVCNDTNAIQVMLYCTLITAMLVLVYKKKNGIRSYKTAKTQFFKELQAAIVLEAIEHELNLVQIKLYLKNQVLKN
jgi:hypothetical protein